jgi:hypothetical protein
MDAVHSQQLAAVTAHLLLLKVMAEQEPRGITIRTCRSGSRSTPLAHSWLEGGYPGPSATQLLTLQGSNRGGGGDRAPWQTTPRCTATTSCCCPW